MTTKPLGRPKTEEPNVKTVGVALRPDEIAIIRTYAKDKGYPSLSSAFRRIVNEWVLLTGRQSQPQLQDPISQNEQ